MNDDAPEIRAPELWAPEIWDCHVHLFDPAHPFARVRAYTPEPAPVAALEQHLHRIGAGRAVLVQASAHGRDNTGVLAALDALGPRHRAVLAPAPALDARTLRSLRERGVRGLRLNPMGRIETIDDAILASLRHTARRAADAGLVLELSAEPTALAALAAELARLPCDVVLPHLAGLAAPGISPRTLKAMRALLERGRTWVKLSGFDRYAPTLTPSIHATLALLLETLPERLVWGSDWPHTPFHTGIPVADDTPHPARPVDDLRQLTDLAATLAPEERERILTRNPATLYG